MHVLPSVILGGVFLSLGWSASLFWPTVLGAFISSVVAYYILIKFTPLDWLLAGLEGMVPNAMDRTRKDHMTGEGRSVTGEPGIFLQQGLHERSQTGMLPRLLIDLHWSWHERGDGLRTPTGSRRGWP